ncbi:MAG: metallophosphoesterase [Lentisphaerae bacterium]|nr:metallophosphoesterase [Lentisphaerota bacterium]
MVKYLIALLLAAAVLGGCRRNSQVAAPRGTSAQSSVNLLEGAAPSFAIVKPGVEPAWQDDLVLSTNDFEELRAWAMPPEFAIKTRYLFLAGDTADFVALELNKSMAASAWFLNGRIVPTPLAGQQYASVPGIPLSLLRPLTNELTGIWTRDELQRFCYQRTKLPSERLKQALEVELRQKVALRGLACRDLALQSGPVVGFAGTNFLTIACRVNLPVGVTLAMDRRTFESPEGFFHRFKVEGLKPDTIYAYSLGATCAGRAAPLSEGPFRTRTLPAQGPLIFAALGDNRSYPETWGRVATAVAKQKPMFVIHTGDLVTQGLDDAQWDSQCLGPAADLLASIPTFVAAGNHEQNSQVYYQMFSVPAGATNWVQEVGPVLFIGLNDISTNSAAWLDGLLAASTAKFIFMVCHYPIVSSSERSPAVMRAAFLPVLTRHAVTAEIAGHDHFYERSELPEGLTVIVTGGAGAPLYTKKEKPDNQPVNPHSRSYLSDYHFCIFTVEGATCSLQALTLDGKVFDRRVWQERKRPALAR